MQTKIASRACGDFVKFKPLTEIDSSQAAATFEKMAKSLADAPFKGVARFELWTCSQTESFTIIIQDGKAKTERNSKREPDLEIITSPETWLQIAQGRLAPLEAFTTGLLRVRGDIKLGQLIMRRLAVCEGRLAIC